MSNAQGVAFLSLGLIVPTSGGTYPNPFDVRYGVDNGNGELGTLTLPIPANVRAGIQYGGDGTQYTGTLYSPSDNDGSWTDEALSLWEEQWSTFGTMATYGPYTFRCIKNPVRSAFNFNLHAVDDQADTIIDMLRTDAIASGLYELVKRNPTPKRPVVLISGREYTINKLENDDDEQPSVRFAALKKQ